jgi:hypothetical protein
MPSKGSVTPDRSGYLDIRSRSAVTFDLDARSPAQVFREPPGDSLFCEFDVVLAPEMWPALCTMARWHGDEHIDLLVLKPDCDDFYLPEGLGYPARFLSVEAGEDDYWAAIGFEPDGDALGSITISVDVVALTGASGTWGAGVKGVPRWRYFRGSPPRAVNGVRGSGPSWTCQARWSRIFRWLSAGGPFRMTTPQR